MLLDIRKIVDHFNIPKRGVFHVGAHHGQEMSLYTEMSIENVVMFEPSSKNFEELGKRLSGSKALLVNLGLSSKDSIEKMYVETANSGMSNSLLVPAEHTKQYPHIKFESTENVTLTTLDNWLSRNPNNANIMSIDVQGYELEVLIGSVKSLEKIDLIICEVNRAELYKDCSHVTEIDVFLRHFGFRRVLTNWEGNTWGDAAYVKENFISSLGLKIQSINLVDDCFSHSKKVLGFDSACLLPTARFDWDREGSGNSNFTVYTDGKITSANKNEQSIAWLLEPKVINESLYEYAKNHHDSYQLVVSHDQDFLSQIPNGRFCPVGGTWIDPKHWSTDLKVKTKNVSIIASEKNITEGHKLRHKAAQLIPKEDRFGRGYKSVKDKIDALREYKFSVVIENVSTDGYFSEKLIDCMISNTVPIYWGCRNIEDFFDPRGIIKFQSIDDLNQLLKNLDFDVVYDSMKDYVISNGKKSRKYSSVDESFFSCVLGLS